MASLKIKSYDLRDIDEALVQAEEMGLQVLIGHGVNLEVSGDEDTLREFLEEYHLAEEEDTRC